MSFWTAILQRVGSRRRADVNDLRLAASGVGRPMKDGISQCGSERLLTLERV
jgi:hypothetical protein